MDATDLLDQELLARAQSGDRLALAAFLEAFDLPLRRLAHGRIGRCGRPCVQTSDLLQLAYLDLLRGIMRFEGTTGSDFLAWANRILVTTAKDVERAASARKRRTTEAGGASAGGEIRRRVVERTPSGVVLAAEDVGHLAEALRSLAPDYREVLALRLREGLAHAEIAARLGRSEGAVRMLLVRARAALALALSARGGDATGAS